MMDLGEEREDIAGGPPSQTTTQLASNIQINNAANTTTHNDTNSAPATSTKQDSTHHRRKGRRRENLQHAMPLLALLCLTVIIWSELQPDGLCHEDEMAMRRRLEGDFPSDNITLAQMRRGSVVLHCAVMLYMFLGLAAICDDYFEPTLDVLCESLSISDDVAGATWMAAGGSAPELFTSMIGVFVAKSDIGFGTIVGSAVFNVLAVIAVCAYCVPDLPVTGWPLARDSVYYCIGILFIVSCVADQRVYWYEALALLFMYFLYVLLMKNNEKLEKIVLGRIGGKQDSEKKLSCWARCQQAMCRVVEHGVVQTLIFIVIIINVTFIICMLFLSESGDLYSFAERVNRIISMFFIAEMGLKLVCYGPLSYWVDVWNALDGVLVILIVVEYTLAQTTASGAVRALRLLRLGRVVRSARIFRLIEQLRREHVTTAVQTDDGHSRLSASKYAQKEQKVEIVSIHQKADLNMEAKKDEEANQGMLDDESDKYASKLEEQERTVIIRKLPRSGRREIFFEKRRKAPPSATGADAAKPKRTRLRLIGMPDGSHKFEEYLSVRGSRVSRSFTGNFNLAIVPMPGKDGGDLEDNSIQEEKDDESESEDLNVWAFPADSGVVSKLIFLVMSPLQILMYYTIVNPQRSWPCSFCLCIAWIAVLSYVMVWMASEIGATANIPEPIMGLTILAAGTSIPDMLSSLAVAKKGRGDMAVSSSIGSNIFDILFGLPVPWLIKTAIVAPGTFVSIQSDGMTIMALSLFLMVAFVILSIQHFGWKLSRKLAYLFAALYLLFLVEALLIEYKVIFSA